MKRKKLAKAVEKPQSAKILAIGIFTLIIVVAILIEALRGHSEIAICLLPAVTTMSMLLFSNIKPKVCYFYENGIKIRRRFVEWKDVTKYEWRDDLLEIRFKSKPKRIVVEDRDGKIKEIIGKYVSKDRHQLSPNRP